MTEPEIYEPAVDFQPLSEVLNSEQLSFVSVSHNLQPQEELEVLQMCTSSCCDFTESLSSEFTSAKEEKEEEEVFTKLSPEHEEREYSLSFSQLISSQWIKKSVL